MCTHPAPDSVENLVILGDVAVDHTKLLWLAHCGDASLNLWINQKKKKAGWKGRMEGNGGRDGRVEGKDGRMEGKGAFVWGFSLPETKIGPSLFPFLAESEKIRLARISIVLQRAHRIHFG